ncbi:MAG: rhomboid family intramembrane serine protease [Chitinophagaceae bacterium]|nr:rhomboid family intramembrane serine protease [Chitinophagaceae bacterium]
MNSLPVAYFIIGITVITSFAAFQNADLINKLICYPFKIKRDKEYWRLATYGLIHADMMHLFFNMFSFYFFGRQIEYAFMVIYGNALVFPLYYLAALVVSVLPSFYKQQNNYNYRSLGASGAVSAVIFSSILLDPWNKVYVYFIGIPGILFAVLYTWYSHRMNQQGQDNIGHDAHLHGALFGLIFPVVTKPYLAIDFFKQLTHPVF